jgi:hypothetical protein
MIGTTISYYRVLEKLGGGGIGVEAEHTKLAGRPPWNVLPVSLPPVKRGRASPSMPRPGKGTEYGR